MAKSFIEIPFIKMHGLGNDFIVIDDLHSKALPSSRSGDLSESAGVRVLTPLTPSLARKMCDRRMGIGADQILWLKKAQNAECQVRMEILNVDGTEAEMCGNGIRAVALYLREHEIEKSPPVHQQETWIETRGGIQKVTLVGDQVTVDMGVPKLGGGFGQAGFQEKDLGVPPSGEKILVGDQILVFYEVNVGNPHAVIFVENLEQTPVSKWGPLLENHSRFPNRTNVEFVQIEDVSHVKAQVWERGAGLTLACGTGACAIAVASIALNKAKSPLNVILPGGTLEFRWQGQGTSVLMTGPAEEVYRGVYILRDGTDSQVI